MKKLPKPLSVFLAAALLLVCAAALAPCAVAADYADGAYTVPFSMEGLGRHNVAWSTATVHVEGGALYVDFTLERVEPRTHAPQFDWAQTSLGSVTPILNDETYTATFLRLPVPNLGRVEVSMFSSAMSTVMDYVLVIDGSSIPAASAAEPTPEPSAEPTPVPSAAPTPEPSTEPTPVPSAEPTPVPSAVPTPEPSTEPTPEPSAEPSAQPSAAPAAEDSPAPAETPQADKPTDSPAPVTSEPVVTIGAETDADASRDTAQPTTGSVLPTGVILAIAAVVVIAAVAIALAVKARKKK